MRWPLCGLLLAVAADANPRRALQAVAREEVGGGRHHHYMLQLAGASPSPYELAEDLNATHVQSHGAGRVMVYASADALHRVLAAGRWGLARAQHVAAGDKLHGLLRAGEVRPEHVAVVAVVSAETDPEPLRRALEARGIAVTAAKATRRRLHFALRSPSDAVAAARLLAQRDEVRWVEPQGRRRELNKVATSTVQSEAAHGHPLWDKGITGAGQVVQVGDTGLDYDSCYFHDSDQSVAFWPDVNLLHRKVVGYVECVDAPTLRRYHEDKPHAHGTHVSGSVCGESAGGTDTQSSYNGLAFKAKLLFVDMACDTLDLGLPIDMADYYGYGASVGAHVSHNSWGMTRPDEVISLDRETDQYLYEHQDYLAVYAAGNSQSQGVLSPAASKNCLTVGAHTNDRQRSSVASFSAFGPTYDGRRKPELLAPGQQVMSAMSNGATGGPQCSVEGKQGTSMAAPFVSAGAVLLRQYFLEGYHPSGRKGGSPPLVEPPGPLLKAMLLNSAEDMAHHSKPPSSQQGFGRLALEGAMYFASDFPRTHLLLVVNETVSWGETASVCFSVDPALDSRHPAVKATLVWFDPPAPDGSKNSMINDLDLTVHGPDGQMHKALKEFGSGEEYDRRNLAEQVRVAAAAGVYRMSVFGHKVTEHAPYEDGLPFSVAVSGPGIQQVDCSRAACPADCGAADGRGRCNEQRKECECTDPWYHQDCGLCSPLSHCSGRGTCEVVGGKPTCRCFSNFVGTDCGKCAPGRYGPDCAGDCKCQHGTCDEAAGLCQCEGNWGGPSCNRCKEGFGNVGGVTDCTARSYWCRNHETVVIDSEYSGWIQLNGGNSYHNSLICEYLILPPTGGTIELQFSFSVEDQYDFISVYQGRDRSGQRLVFKSGQGRFTVSVQEAAFILFESDLYDEGGQVGFTGQFLIPKPASGSPSVATTAASDTAAPAAAGTATPAAGTAAPAAVGTAAPKHGAAHDTLAPSAEPSVPALPAEGVLAGLGLGPLLLVAAAAFFVCMGLSLLRARWNQRRLQKASEEDVSIESIPHADPAAAPHFPPSSEAVEGGASAGEI
eukprot:TRINITY_DN1643_c0_g1_i1.p1 TRINITY_DN1643_c0_g1~~TRINITY_DN1643_c0_g1_i1.p1  ORF type:complete len:1077 (+),score=357.25 TRINITY_DN1643_c0_g1_i1:59-3232(+)